MSNKEAIKIHRKAFADIHRLCPKLFPSILLYSLVEAVSPYVTIYLSARLIDELAGLRRPSVLWGWVAWTVGAGCALMLLRACLLRWKKVEEEVFAIKQEQLFAKKFFSMDFADIDQAKYLRPALAGFAESALGKLGNWKTGIAGTGSFHRAAGHPQRRLFKRQPVYAAGARAVGRVSVAQ